MRHFLLPGTAVARSFQQTLNKWTPEIDLYGKQQAVQLVLQCFKTSMSWLCYSTSLPCIVYFINLSLPWNLVTATCRQCLIRSTWRSKAQRIGVRSYSWTALQRLNLVAPMDPKAEDGEIGGLTNRMILSNEENNRCPDGFVKTRSPFKSGCFPSKLTSPQ